MEIQQPTLVYTAESTVEAQTVVQLLKDNGIPSYAQEAAEGSDMAGLAALGGSSPFQPQQILVEKAAFGAAVKLLREFEKRDGSSADSDAPKSNSPIVAQCEECDASSEFPAEADGTTQTCPKCQAFMDVGSLDWGDEDFGEVAESG